MSEEIQENPVEFGLGPSKPMNKRLPTLLDEIIPFKFELSQDEMNVPHVLNIHPKWRAPRKLEFVSKLGEYEITGSKRRKMSVFDGYKPEKFDGKQFRHCFLQGNETSEQILQMKKDALEAEDFGDEFYKKETDVCLNYLKNFVKERMVNEELKWKKKVEHHALRMYETVVFEDVPLDIPEVALPMLKNRTRKLQAEFTKVRDYAEGCVSDIFRNSFEKDGAGQMRAQKFLICEPLSEVKTQKPYIPPNFDTLSEESAYRILNYYDLPNKLADLETMKSTIRKHFEKGVYSSMEEILQSLATARIGLNDLEFSNRNQAIDEIYSNVLLNVPDYEEDSSSSVEGSPTKKRAKVVLMNSDSAEKIVDQGISQNDSVQNFESLPSTELSPKKLTPKKFLKSTRGRGGLIRGRKRGGFRGAKRGT